MSTQQAMVHEGFAVRCPDIAFLVAVEVMDTSENAGVTVDDVIGTAMSTNR